MGAIFMKLGLAPATIVKVGMRFFKILSKSKKLGASDLIICEDYLLQFWLLFCFFVNQRF